MKKEIIFIFKIMFLTIIVLLIYNTLNIIVQNPDKIETMNNVYMIETHFNVNQLNEPFPNYPRYVGDEETIISMFEKNIFEFHEILEKNYYYSENEYDCKYWAYVWANWWKYHQHEYDLRVIATENHVFTILYNNDMYCIADQKILNCIYL